MRVIGYTRVSTDGQGLGLEAQRGLIEAAVQQRGWELVALLTDRGLSGKSLMGRLALAEALDSVESGGADGIVTAKLDRLSRSTLDFAMLMERAKKHGWHLVALDLGVDTSTPQGSLIANVFSAFAQFERELISQRTSEALQALKRSGRRLGRPSALAPEVLDRVVEARGEGMPLREIAAVLESKGIRTATGKRTWHASTVRAALQTAALDDEASPR